MIITSEADIAKVPSLQDRREMRNFMRFLRVWPKHKPDMLRRSRWQKYLVLTQQEAETMSRPTHWRCPLCEGWHEHGPSAPTCTLGKSEQ